MIGKPKTKMTANKNNIKLKTMGNKYYTSIKNVIDIKKSTTDEWFMEVIGDLLDASRRAKKENWITKHIDTPLLNELEKNKGLEDYHVIYRKRLGGSVEESIAEAACKMLEYSSYCGYSVEINCSTASEMFYGELAKNHGFVPNEMLQAMRPLIELVLQCIKATSVEREMYLTQIFTYLYHMLQYFKVDLIKQIELKIEDNKIHKKNIIVNKP